jgi:NAD(P)-dependent dehydrogenase (short-subunit alcohol dehydrogenase family)
MKKDPSLKWRHDAASLNVEGIKVAIIGGTGGIGRAFSRYLASHGADVVVVGQTFKDADLPQIQFIQADLSLMREAQRVAAMLPAEELDVAIFTTGIMAGPQREVTAEGIERDMAVSYLSRLVILRGIAPRLGHDRSAALPMKPRVFVMGFPGVGQTGNADDLNAEKSYRRWAVHMNTVAGNEMLVLDAAKHYPNANFFGLNPGFIKSNIRSNLFGGNKLLYRFIEGPTGLMTSNPESYVERVAPLLVSLDLKGHSGAMFDRNGQAILPSPKLNDDTHMQAFIRASESLVAKANVNV